MGKDTAEYKILHTWDTALYRLFELIVDPGQTNDLAVPRPDIVELLRKQMEDWQSGNGRVNDGDLCFKIVQLLGLSIRLSII